MKRIFIVIVLLACGLSLWAQSAQVLVESAGSSKEYPGAPTIVVFDSTKVNVETTGLSHYFMHRLYKVLNAQGALNLKAVKIDYDPLSAYVEIRRAVIYRANGERQELKVSNVKDYPAPARMIYWGAREKMLEVGQLDAGDALEVEFYRKGFTYALLQSEDDRYIPPMRGHYYDIVEFWSSVPLLSKVYTVNVPKEKQLQFKFYNGECTSSVEFKNDRALYTFKAKNIMPMEQEPRQVALSDVAPKLLISTSPDWKAKSLWFHKVNEDFGSFEATPEVKAQTELILKGAVSEQDSIARLTHWVADNIRYSGISMGPGEGYTLHKGAMTFLDRCGVCKDKAGMLITMLRAAGFESYPAMTMAGSRIDYIPADQFNHSVTVVKHRNGNYEMLDPTWVPFLRELWSSAEQQQNYLMGVPEGADLLVTPVSAPENHYYRISGTSTLKKDGSLEGEMEVTAEGQSDAALRRFFTGSFKTDWKTNIEKELLRVAPKAILEELDYGSDPYNYMAGPIKIRMKYRIPEFAIVTGKEIICNPFIAARMFHNQQGQLAFNIGLKERKYPFTDRCSRLVELNETVNLPEDFSLEGKAVREESNGSGASAKGSLEQKETRLVLNYEGKYFKRVYAAEDWNSFKNAVEIQNKLTETPIVLLSR